MSQYNKNHKWLLLLEAVHKRNSDIVSNVLETSFPQRQGEQMSYYLPKDFQAGGQESSPLHYAILTTSTKIVKLLVEGGLSIHDRNQHQEYPLHLACRKGRQDVVLYLLGKGADINCRDCEDNTPLFSAVTYSHPHIADLLVNAGCEINTLNEELMSPLDQAILYDQREVIKILLQAGCSLDKAKGHIYYEDHYANSVLTSLWRNGDIHNIHVMHCCGYQFNTSDVQKLLKIKQHKTSDSEEVNKSLVTLINTPLTLQGYSRLAIRKCLFENRSKGNNYMESNINHLPIPNYLKKILAFKVEV